MIMIKLKSALIKEVGSKDDIMLKTHGVNNEYRVFNDNHVAIELRVSYFLRLPGL